MSARVALVTGSAKRLGRAICETLAGAGYSLALHYHRSENEAREFAADLQRRGIAASLHRADQANLQDVDRLARAVGERWGRLDVLVNSASIFRPVPFAELDESTLDAFFSANVKGPLFLCQKMLPWLKQAGAARVVNITDIYADIPLRDYMAYTISKSALANFTRALALEWAPHGITVNAVAPGAILFPPDMPEAAKQSVVRKIPLQRHGSPEDIARAVLFLVESGFVTGQTLAVDGGRSIAP